MSTTALRLDAGGMLPAGTKCDAAAAEQVVARTYRHPALGDRPVIRLASDRLGQAEDLAMEFLGFEAPAVSKPVAVQQRRSLGFAAWALVNDAANARFALDLVKRMKAAARKARSKPGHAWDAYAEMAKDLGRSVRHFLPPYWEEVGRTFKDLGNQTYAGRALNKSLEAERVHALDSDRARRRDVVLEFVLSGCLAGNALSEYGNDLQAQYPPQEAFAIFRDLCLRRTRGGMSPWATMPKEFMRLAKLAGLDVDQELEKWLEEVIESPAMGRSPHQFWKTCSGHCGRIVARNVAFAVSLLRHTRPDPSYYGASRTGPWLELLEQWGVFSFLWEDGHRGAPPLGEPVATWFGRIVRDGVPASKLVLEMLEKLAPRLKQEKVPLPLSVGERHRATLIDIDVLEACCALRIPVDDLPAEASVTFDGWLTANVDHPLRNQDIVASWKDDRFRTRILDGLGAALQCLGGVQSRGYRSAELQRRPFPQAAGDRPGIRKLWHLHTSKTIARLESAGLASFKMAAADLESTLWPDTLRLFPDLADRLNAIDVIAMLTRTLQAGVFDEYGLPALEQVAEAQGLKIKYDRYGDKNIHLLFPWMMLHDGVHGYVTDSDGTVQKHELRIPKKTEISGMVPLGNDLAVSWRDDKYQGHFHWVSNPAQQFEAPTYLHSDSSQAAVVLGDGCLFLGAQIIHPGDKTMPVGQPFLYDGTRFWRIAVEWDQASMSQIRTVAEVDPQTGKVVRKSVPSWFEETDDGTVEWIAAELLPAPRGAVDSPLGTANGLVGWKTIRRRDGNFRGEGIDGRCWDKPLVTDQDTPASPVALLNQPGTKMQLPVTRSNGGRSGDYFLWDPTGSTVIATLTEFKQDAAPGQVTVLPLRFWHLLKIRDLAASKTLRGIRPEQSSDLLAAAAKDREIRRAGMLSGRKAGESPPPTLPASVKKFVPTAPERLIKGIAGTVADAEKAAADFTAVREKTFADLKKAARPSAQADGAKSSLAAAQWRMRAFNDSRSDTKGSVSDHLLAVAEFFKGEAPAGDLPRTNYLWFPLLENLPLDAWRTFWRASAAKLAQKDDREVLWLEFLKLIHASGLLGLPGQFAIMDACPEGAKRTGRTSSSAVEGGKSYSLQNGDDRFVIVKNESYYSNSTPDFMLRYSTAANPGTPPGYDVSNLRTVKPGDDSAEIGALIAAAESCTALPLPSRKQLEEVARSLSCSPVEIGLIWMGGLKVDSREHNFLPAALRNAFGWSAAAATAGRQSLCNINEKVRSFLYEAILAKGCAAPFAADRGPVLQSLEKTWRAKMPARLTLDAGLQKRLSAIGKTSRWDQVDHVELLVAAANPATHPLLQPRELAIEIVSDRSYSSLQVTGRNKGDGPIAKATIRSILQLVGLVHSETAAGHAARSAMPALIRQVTSLLDHPGTMFDLQHFGFYTDAGKAKLTPTEWINQYVGTTKAHPKDGTARFDDGLIAAAAVDSKFQVHIAFRPSKFKGRADLVRLQALHDADPEYSYGNRNSNVPVVAAIKSTGFQKLAAAILAPGLSEGQWPQNPNLTAPGVLKAMQKKLKLGADAAVLYAQLLALPDPTVVNICAWNGWKPAQFTKAAAELVARKLVLEASRARAARPVFLPGEWLDLKAPWLPIETWKLAHLVDLDLDLNDPCPAGGPMVLRPFEDLFAAAWKRVQEGDVPRYQEVQRKAKKK